LVSQGAQARGPSPYLPLDLSPHIERQIERVLILAGKPAMRKPIAAAVVLEALPSACLIDEALCEEVRSYLSAYRKPYAVTSLKPRVALTAGDSKSVIPNQHGERVDSAWQVSASGYYQPNDYLILNAGGVAYDGNATATGSFLSTGFDFAQLDIGFRDHWFSPLSDSSSLISTEAPTMPSITLSNYRPITPLGIGYEVFAAEMSRQDGISLFNSTTSGKPRMTGTQVSIEPATGYALALNRVVQFGGGARNKGFSQFIDSLVNNSNNPDSQGAAEEFGNQVVSITSSFLVPGRVPFGVNIEYGGEDNTFAKGYRLGATNLSLGIDLPRLWQRFDANFEISEWQNAWYIHHLYPQGLVNHGEVIGHWFGDQRVFGDAIGGRSEMLAVGWQRNADQYLRFTYRTMALDPRWVRTGNVPPYERYHSLGVSFNSSWRGYPVEVELSGGRDILGDSFARLSGAVDFSSRSIQAAIDSAADEVDFAGVDLFVDVGMNNTKVLKILAIGTPSDPAARGEGVHVGVGARRAVSKRGDLGTRLELDEVDGYRLLSLRALDYRYRVTQRIAVGGFFGFGRYDYGLPTDGYYWGAGVQLRDVLPKWDIGFDVRHYEKLSRDKALPTDPVPTAASHPRLYIDMDGTSVYVSRRW
jgi:hypothetical protein